MCLSRHHVKGCVVGLKLRQFACVRAFVMLSVFFAGATAFASDLQITNYSVSSDPVANGADAVFTIQVDNSGPTSVNNAVVTVNISPKFTVGAPVNYPSYCVLSGVAGSQTLTCTLPTPLAVGVANTQIFSFTAKASAPGSANTKATVSAFGNTDSNTANDSLTVTPSVKSGADISVTNVASAASIPAGSVLNYTLTAHNAGPNTTSAIEITENLPATADYLYQGYSGTGWTCSLAGTVVTCGYSGAAAAIGADYPVLTINGKAVSAVAGNVSSIASVRITDPQVLDPNPNNNTSPLATTAITAGSDLQALKSMPAITIVGSNATITLSILNNGPQVVPAGTQISDAIAANFTVGAPPAGCSKLGQTVTCTTAGLAIGQQVDFLIPVTGVTATSSASTNTANLTLPSGYIDSNPPNNTASASFEVLAANADLRLQSKVKVPNPVKDGANVTSTITVDNQGPSIASYDPAHPIRVKDTLDANETYVSSSGPWSCTYAAPVVSCATTGTGTLAVGSAATPLSIITKPAAGTDGSISNTACTDRTAGSSHTPSTATSPTGNDCSAANVRSTPKSADLKVLKDVSLTNSSGWSSNLTIPDTQQSFYIRLIAQNLSGDTARTVNVTDALPNYITDGSNVTAVIVDSTTTGTATYNQINGTVSWSLANLAVGTPQTLILKVTRPFENGTFTNTASIFSSDTTETDNTNNTGSASYTIAAVADVTLTSKTITPNPAQVGVVAHYIVSAKNIGGNQADNVLVHDIIDSTRYDIVGTPTTTKSGATCGVNRGNAITCSMGTLARNESQQIDITVLPKYPFGGHTALSDFPVSQLNTANIMTSTLESDNTNNSISLTHNVIAPALDLGVTKVETNPATDDPIGFGQTLNYDVRISNYGPSRATDIVLKDLPTPPAGMAVSLTSTIVNPAGASANGGLTFQSAPNATCVPSGGNYICKIDPSTVANNYLDAGKQVLFRMVYSLTGTAPDVSTTNTNTVEISSAEQPVAQGAGADSQTANNQAVQTTTVLPSTDLAVLSKTRTGALVRDINEPIEFTIRIANNGPSKTTQVRVTDQLPTGFIVSSPAPSFSLPAGSTATVSALNCSGTTTVVCILDGIFPGDSNSKVDLKINERTADPYTGVFTPANSTNAAAIAPGLDSGGNALSRDSNSGNNSASADAQIRNASIAGIVYNDLDRNDAIAASGEGIDQVSLLLTGTDNFGNSVSRTTKTDSTGAYKFDQLPPSGLTGYTIVETQPGGYFDRNETAGTAGGIVNNATYGSAAAQNTISNIVLGSNINATGYIFQEYQQAQVSGYIYRDLNNNGVRDAGETGYPPASFSLPQPVRLTGNDYAGVPVNITTTIDANGFYSFPSVPPSNSYGYVVTELAQPTGASDGKDTNGIGAVVPNSNGRGSPEDIIVGLVNPNNSLTERDFGELPTSTLSGIVYFDANKNAVHDGTETAGLAGAIIKLSGTNDLGETLNCSITTDATGVYSFPKTADADPKCLVLRPGTYSVTETPPPGLTHTGAYIGSSGGTSGGVNTANSVALGVANVSVTSITVPAGSTAANYNFGESGQGLTGTVYIDANNNGTRDANEVGIPEIVVTLSGTTATGQDVCGIITCVVSTDSVGNYAYLNLPGSNATGYTITEQSQNSSPLSNYADGQDKVGGLSGSSRGIAGNDIFTGITIGNGELLTNYQFGEIASSLAGKVYIDNNDNGVVDTGEPGIAGVQVTLSGIVQIGNSAVNICAYLSALTPALSCTATTVADGSYSFNNLPAGTYILTETQPSAFATGKETAGTAGGTTTTNTISAITLAAGTASTGNLFGEHAVSIGGYVFKDPQRDGVDSGSEPRFAGVVIILHDQSGAEIARTTTGTDGSFSFNNLPAGTYTIEEVQPAGYGVSTPKTVAVTVTAGGAQQLKFGNTYSSVGGNVFVDASNDGVRQSTERGIGSVTLTLTGTDAAGRAVSATTTTAADGTYKFDTLLAGTYTITETQPTNYVNGINHQGTAGGTVGNNVISAIALSVATDATAYDFGERGQGLSGVVYDDRNRNGVKDATDPALSGVTIELRQNGALIATTVTGADGRYSFPDIEAGMYDVVEIQPNGYSSGAENNSNTNHFTVVAGTQIPDVNFGELTGSLAGLVYNDSNGNAQRDPNEPVIPNTVVTLSGTTARGENICTYLAALSPAGTCNQITAQDGSYKFAGLPDGTYTLNETQPAGFGQGTNMVGTSGGVISADQIGSIALANSADAAGYLFGEKGASGQISGTVWFDANHDRIRESSEQLEAGWTVQLLLGNTVVSTTITDSKGAYGFSNIAPGTGYRIRFVSPKGTAMGGSRTNEDNSAANPGKAQLINGEITNITLVPGGTVPQQSLPLDPSGVVYDSVRRTLVENATVTISGPSGFDPSLHLLGGATNLSQKTAADGIYQFLLLSGAPAGTYTLKVTPPSGSYNPTQPSSIIPPCTGPHTVGATPDPALMSLIDGAPALNTVQNCAAGTASTAYFLSFTLTPGVSAPVINNNIPIDPVLKGAIVVTKTTPLVNVTRGQLVPYSISARNTLNGSLTGITISDYMPAGFQYRINSARINNVAAEPARVLRELSWINQSFAPQETKRYDLLLTVGAGVKEGNHVNQAYAVNQIVQTKVSDIAEATVRIVPDADFDCTDIIGKVFDDKNNNGIQDNDEPGLPGVRLATVNGLLVTTDQFGRYHITCPMIANEDRGSNFILKLDTRTLPTGYRMTTENPETVRLTRGKFVKLNFGASLNRVVRLDVTGAAFNQNDVIETYKTELTKLAATLAEKPSVLRVVYTQTSETKETAKARINALVDAIRNCWRKDGDRYRLTIEQEIITPESHVEGGVQ